MNELKDTTGSLAGKSSLLDAQSPSQVESVVVRTVARIMVPFIQLFGLYVIIHGETSPGGGFQGGVILGTSIILLAIVFDLPMVERRISRGMLTVFMSVGVLVFSGIGILDMLFGGKYLQYSALPLPISHHYISTLSILGVELGIGITVMAVIILLFFYMVGDQKC